jgi:hypothetical protein
MWIVLSKICSQIELLGWQDNDVVVYRINGDELPKEDVMVALHISIIPGVGPFVNNIEKSEHTWQPSNN